MRRGSLTRKRAAFAVLAVTALLAVGCGRAGSGGGSAAPSASSGAAKAASGNFGNLTDVCHPGGATGAADQGVTSSKTTVGVLTDVGFTKDPQLVNLAHVFTSWCNAAGGIDGRKLVADVHDTQLFNVVAAMTKACASDFALAGMLKDDPPEQLIAAVRTVAMGNALLSPAITKRVIRRFTRLPRPTPPKEFGELTEREREILRLIATGLSNAEIGRKVYISETTVKTHVTHILQKLSLRDRVQAVVLAYQTGLFERGPDN